MSRSRRNAMQPHLRTAWCAHNCWSAPKSSTAASLRQRGSHSAAPSIRSSSNATALERQSLMREAAHHALGAAGERMAHRI